MITYKFRLYPSKKQEQKILETLDKSRFVYNKLLEGLNKQDKPNRLKLQASLPELKNQYPELKNVYSKVLQYEVHRLFSNLKALRELKKKGKKVGRLRFKSGGWFKTFTYNQPGFRLIETDKRYNRLHLFKIGDIPIRAHREIKGKVKQITIKKHNSGKWYACISAENETGENITSGIQKWVGLDVGITHFVSDTNGRQIENPQYLGKTLKKLRLEDRRFSRRKKESKNRNKLRVRRAKIFEKVVNQRNDFLHKLSRAYVDNYDVIVVENLNINGMVKNHHLARTISDASWSTFTKMLDYKAENAGKIVVKVDPKNTSKIYNYGKELDRDYNASLNILQRGLEKLPQGLWEVTPVKIEPLRKLETISASSIVETGSPLR